MSVRVPVDSRLYVSGLPKRSGGNPAQGIRPRSADSRLALSQLRRLLCAVRAAVYELLAAGEYQLRRYDVTAAIKRCIDCKHAVRSHEVSDYYYCTHPEVAGDDIDFLAGRSIGLLSFIERRKRFFGACGRDGKLWETK